MTNPAQAIRSLITYAICIPLAILMGFIMTEIGDRPDYSNLFVVGIVIALLLSPIFIKWHYPIMIFGLSCPAYCFFLSGNPPLWQVVVILSLGIAILNRTLNSEKHFVSPAVMTWPLLFTIAMVYATAEMTGGIGLKAMGGEVAGGKKYIALFIGCATFFALTSHYIPKEKRGFYIALYFLAGSVQFISDMFPFLPAPLNYINLLIPPSESNGADFSFGMTRLGGVASSAGVVANFMMAKYGLRGIFRGDKPQRFLLFFFFLGLTMLGGFRSVLVAYLMIGTMLFFLEGLHRTRLLMVFILGGILFLGAAVPFANKLPFTVQRTLSFLPIKLDPMAVMEAESSTRWREEMWRDIWPQVPGYLLLGKGYALTKEDFQSMGDGIFANTKNTLINNANNSLAISGDYHNGPLSTLMPFGIWGAISFIWLSLAAMFVMFRNYKFGDAEIKPVNTFLMVLIIQQFIGFFFIFGAYSDAVGSLAKLTGLSIALNWGICRPTVQAVVNQRIKPLLRPRPAALKPA